MRLLLFLSITFSSNLYSQEQFFDIMSSLIPPKMPGAEIKALTQTEYSTFSLEEDAIPDTIVQINDTKFELYINSKSITEFISPTESTTVKYDKSGKKKSTTHTLYNSVGLIIHEETSFGEDAIFAQLNSYKEFQYDHFGQVTSLINNGDTVFNIQYFDKGLINRFTVDGGIATAVMQANGSGDTIQYEMEMQFASDLMEFMGKEQVPRERMELYVSKEEDKTRTFHHYKESEQTKEFNIHQIVEMDTLFGTISSKKFNDQGELEHHFRFDKYEDGRNKTLVDLMNNSSYDFEYNSSNKVLKEYSIDGITWYTYDLSNRIIATIVTNLEGSFIFSATFNVYSTGP